MLTLLEELKVLTSNPNLECPEIFMRAVNLAIACFNLDKLFLARKFGCSVGVVDRWIAGTAAPHYAMRKPVYNYFIDLIKAH